MSEKTAPQGAKIESAQAQRHDGGANDHVKVGITLPETGWTGRLQGIGGSAYAAGNFGAPLVQAVKDGYTAVTTHAGVLGGLDTEFPGEAGRFRHLEAHLRPVPRPVPPVGAGVRPGDRHVRP